MPDLIGRTVQCMGIAGITTQEVHDWLVDQGLNEVQAYYTYIAALIIVKGKEAR